MNTATILDLIDARQAVATAFCDDLREQIAKLTGARHRRRPERH
jgi:hypothetical protein